MNKKPGIDTRRLCYQFTNFGNTNLDITKCPLNSSYFIYFADFETKENSILFLRLSLSKDPCVSKLLLLVIIWASVTPLVLTFPCIDSAKGVTGF